MVKIGIIDFVSTFSKYVEEAVTKAGAQYDVFEHDADIETLKNYDGFIFTGSPDTVYEGGKQADPRIFDLNKPILGICYGHQLIHYMLGGEVRRSNTPEQGNFYFTEIYSRKKRRQRPCKYGRRFPSKKKSRPRYSPARAGSVQAQSISLP